MIKYQQTKIYKIEPICPHDEGEVYIGSTTKKLLCSRWAGHVYEYRKTTARVRQQTTVNILFDKYGLANCRIELLELYPCNSKDEQNKKESEYIRQMPCVNRCIPDRTKAEYCRIYREDPEHWKRQLELQRLRRKSKADYTEDEWKDKMRVQREYRSKRKSQPTV